ncbi:MAG: type II toxin-antitoxin system PemK/MazF family toxin [Mycobacteriales bacterium]
MHRGEIYWVDLGQPRGSAPGYRRPVLVVSSDRFNASRIRTLTVAALPSNPRLAQAPGTRNQLTQPRRRPAGSPPRRPARPSRPRP